MKFIILCYNPNFVESVKLNAIFMKLKGKGHDVYSITHHQSNSLPFYIMTSETQLTGITKK